MADLKTPGVYLDKVNTGSASIDGTSTSVCAFMGKAPRGDINTGFVMISSWTDFVQKASFGCNASVFRDDDYMAYNIYNFYQNGGGKAYFGVVKASDAEKATVKLGTDNQLVLGLMVLKSLSQQMLLKALCLTLLFSVQMEIRRSCTNSIKLFQTVRLLEHHTLSML